MIWKVKMTFNEFKKMRKNVFIKSLILLFVGILCFTACSNEEIIPSVDTVATGDLDPNLETKKVSVTLDVPGSSVNSRLAYEYAEENGSKAIKLFWDKDDSFTMNLQPSDEQFAYELKLKEGAGTKSATFEGEVYSGGFHNCLLYFPGSKITSDKSYYEFSYLGQVQKGNNNMDHLKDYHTMRVDNSSQSVQYFNESLIDFTGDAVSESSCFRFNLNNLPELVPVSIDLMYINPSGVYESCFYLYNYGSYYGSYAPNGTRSHQITLGLEEFDKTTEITAYMMLSNATVQLREGGILGVCVTDENGNKYYCEKELLKDAALYGGRLNTITCREWEKVGDIDGVHNPDKGIVVLQEASIDNGADIVIMGDGFSESHFTNGNYKDIMEQAYEDFFSVEPYSSLREYFNVYYINAVSEEDHDAVPSTNGAINGDAVTIFNTKFVEGSTNIDGNHDLVTFYTRQAIRYKGGKGGTECTDAEAITRSGLALSMVMVNVPCHAGTCWLWWTNDTNFDYGNAKSIAYTALNRSDEQRRLVTVHEAGGHGFGKLKDEYGGNKYTDTEFKTSIWTELSNLHSLGVYRNVNEYWGQEERDAGFSLNWTDTTVDNVYWSDLLSSNYSYTIDEGLGIYRGAATYEHLYCRPTDNSIMRSNFPNVVNGDCFNAISRWAIWYRLMRLTGSTTVTQFKNSLDEFVEWDQTIPNRWSTSASTRSVDLNYVEDNQLAPLAPPVLIKARWVNGRLVDE